jgi:hypothetical protein
MVVTTKQLKLKLNRTPVSDLGAVRLFIYFFSSSVPEMVFLMKSKGCTSHNAPIAAVLPQITALWALIGVTRRRSAG